jgi:DNA-binding transcriptional LysR family regulator
LRNQIGTLGGGFFMEMHQIRYFLAVAETFNFTRAAEHCHVAQPSLTRAIKLLEDELGGDLFRRERKLTHMTQFGLRMLPLMQQCYASALSAKQLATSLKSGEVAPLTVSLYVAIDMALLVRPLRELTRAFPSLELTFLRGSPIEVAGHLKKGEADVAIAGPLEEKWDRLDAWVLFSEEFDLVVNEDHRLAGSNEVGLTQLRGERFLSRPYCEMAESLVSLLRSHGLEHEAKHKMVSEHDLAPLLQANLGVGILPRSFRCDLHLARLPVHDLDLERTVSLYAVAGRPRSCAVSTFMKLLRAADWPEELKTFSNKASANVPAAG